MKKLLFTLLLAAGTLTAWAYEKYPAALYVVGNATSFDWGPSSNPATAPILYQKSEKVYEGFVNFDETNGELKFLATNEYNKGQWGPSKGGTSVNSSTANLSYVDGGSPDNKFRFNLNLGLYLITVDLTTEGSESVTFKEWKSTGDGADVYEIGNLNQLKAFADCVNKYDATISGKLTANIGDNDNKMDYAIGWYDSGESNKLYSGEFNGNGYTIYLGIDDTNNGKKGLFGAATGGANIHDVIVAGSVRAKEKVAGIIGYADGGGKITLSKVINKASVQSTGNYSGANAAGLVGCAVSNTIFDASFCGNAGDVSGYNGECAAFAGWTQDNGQSGNDNKKTVITSCWNTGIISGMENNCNLYRNTGMVNASGCYDASATGTRTQGTRLTVNGVNNVSISNVTDLTNFSSIVNLGANFLNAELTADIATYSGDKIGDSQFDESKDYYYTGTFDGKGHKITISYNNSSENEIALFKYVNGCTIKNLIVDGSITGNKFLAGLVNYAYRATTIQNVVVAVNITSSLDGDGTHGGVISVAEGEGTPIMENVAFVGSISASKSSGTCGLIGYAHNGGRIVYRNCYVSGTLTIADGKVFGRHGEFCENCYTTNTTLDKLDDSPRFLSGGKVEAGDVSSGKLCYLLNGDQKNIIWYQNLSGDSYPVPFSSHSRVYASPATGSLKCD